MRWSPTWAIALKVLRTLRRDKRGLALMLLGPLLQIMVIGFVFGSSVSNIQTVIVNQDRGVLGDRFVTGLNDTILDIHLSPSVKVARDKVNDGQAWAAIVIPPGFSETIEAARAATGAGAPPAGAPATLQTFMDGSNAQIVASVNQEIQRSLRTVSGNMAVPAVVVSQDTVYASDAKPIDFFVAALMGFAVFNFTAITTVTAFVSERTSGMLARLQAGPIRSSEIVLGHALGYGVVAILQASLLLTMAVLAYGIKVQGPIWLAFLVVILLAIASQALGMLLSAAARRESQAIQMFPIIIIPALVVSGTFVPIFSLPFWLRPLAYVVPIYWSSEALRSVLLRGWGLDRVWPHVLMLTAFAGAFLLLAVRLLNRQRR